MKTTTKAQLMFVPAILADGGDERLNGVQQSGPNIPTNMVTRGSGEAAARVAASTAGMNHTVELKTESKPMKKYRRRMAKLLGDALDRGDNRMVRRGIKRLLKVVERASH